MDRWSRQDQLARPSKESGQGDNVCLAEGELRMAKDFFVFIQEAAVGAQGEDPLTNETEHLCRRSVDVQKGEDQDAGVKDDVHASAGRPR